MSKYRLFFWDFDGVIKDSVEVKTHAFKKLFSNLDKILVDKIISHHLDNSGISRFEKMPLYFKMANLDVNETLIKQYLDRFSFLVKDEVIQSNWVPGAKEYLLKNYLKQDFYLVTATPQFEIEKILDALKISHVFKQVFGAPTKKNEAIRGVISDLNIPPTDAVMIGDASADLQASMANNIDFILRKTDYNKSLQTSYLGPQILDFSCYLD